MATVAIPSLLRPLVGGQRQVSAAGRTVGEVIAALDTAYPGVRERLCAGDRLQPGIAVAVDGVIAEGLHEPVRPDSEIYITPAIAGGAPKLRRRRSA